MPDELYIIEPKSGINIAEYLIDLVVKFNLQLIVPCAPTSYLGSFEGRMNVRTTN